MNMIYVGVRNEFTKLLCLKKYKTILVLLFFFSIGAGLLGRFTKGFVGMALANTPLAILSIITRLLLPLIISLAAADLFTAEQENGSIKAIVTRPVGRASIFTSKVVAIVLYIILALMVCLVTSSACGVLLNGASLMTIAEAILAYTVSIVPMFPFILFAAAISQFCRNSSSTVMLTVFGYIVIVGIGTAISNVSPMVFTSYTGWYKLFIGAHMPVTNILNVVALLVAYTLILYAVGSWAFEKKQY